MAQGGRQVESERIPMRDLQDRPRENPIHWFVIECTDQKFAVIKWDLAAATSPTARHFCREAHAQTYISRFFAGLTIEDTSEVLGISTATVKRDWVTARACFTMPSPESRRHEP